MMDTILTSHAEVGVWLSQLLSTSYQRGMARTMERSLQPLVDFSQVSREAERFGCSERTYRRVINQLIEEHYIQKVAHEYVICDIEKFRQVLTHPGRIA